MTFAMKSPGRVAIAVAWAAICGSGGGAPAAAEGTPRWTQPAAVMPLASGSGAADGDGAFAVPPGFVIERLFTVPKDELGSWVSLTSDPEGRLIASDQGGGDQHGQGLVRISPAPLDGSGDTIVERIPVPLTGAQGLLWAFDSLYVVCNGGPGSGLYRVTDSDGDDVLDHVVKLREFAGGGEHGPHAVVLSPDGTRLFIVCGNHTKPPFDVTDVTPPQTMGGIREDGQRRVALAADGTSRLPANWDEDLVIRRMWDGNGHAAGILAPGGYVVSTDPEGTTWELWSAGYRNPYDIAFNADGELFVYDADMEWDFGTPWYRPTRVNHATSGSEFGWRSGTGKWSAAVPDALPATVDIGPGSPVGVTFGSGSRFPAKYQQALYVCDWTFGTMYAIHLEPDGSTYRGTKEEFVARAPLPLTDVTIGRDGAMYFVVGGRGAQSELYRVTYAGSEPQAPIDPRNPRGAAARAARHALEAAHRPVADPATAVALALPALSSSDRFLRYAARVALEHQPLDTWLDAALAQADPRARIGGAIAAARQADPAAQPAILAALDAIDPSGLDTATRLDLVRAVELAIIRLGEPPAEARGRIAARLGPLFPSGDFDLDRELSSLLVAVRAPGIVPTLVGMLAVPTDSATVTNLAPNEEDLQLLITRNQGYGGAVRQSLENRPDLLQIHYAFILRTVHEKDLWSREDLRGFFAWFGRARQWAGGNSFQKFLTNIENERIAGMTDNDRLALETLGLRTPWVAPPLPKAEGPGRSWTAAEVLAVAQRPGAAGVTAGRDFDHGRRAFAAARCIVCHRFGEEGGATGPDLTQAGGRFRLEDLVESICEPSRVVSDQYKASVVQTADGRVVTGRIVVESPEAITIVTDPEDATKFAVISRSDIEAVAPATESLMPRGLLDQLNEEEVLDLLAYTLSRDKPRDPRFRGK
jgi:putative heme-binding domain-containing protein